MKHAPEFFAFARERYNMLLLRRAGNPPPWTQDPVLANYRFCNVFREDDTVTQWVKENIRKPLHTSHVVISALCTARFINRISTLQALLPYILEAGWDERCLKVLRRMRRAEETIITGAYMIRTPFGKQKPEGLHEILQPLADDAQVLHLWATASNATLQGFFNRLTEYNYVGRFMAYEVVTDLRHTGVLIDAPDINTWANAGPGAARGLSRVIYGRIGAFNYNSEGHQLDLNEHMRELLKSSRDAKNWPAHWPRWEMREVEHTLCEFDKYCRANNGEGEPKQNYTPPTK